MADPRVAVEEGNREVQYSLLIPNNPKKNWKAYKFYEQDQLEGQMPVPRS